MENSIRNWKYTLPLIYFQPYLIAAFGLTYGLMARFSPEDEYKNHFSSEISTLSFLEGAHSKRLDQLQIQVKSDQILSPERHIKTLREISLTLSALAEIKHRKKLLRDYYFGDSRSWNKLISENNALRSEKSDEDLFNLWSNAEYQWVGDSLVMIWSGLKLTIAGKNRGAGDQDLRKLVDWARREYYLKSGGRQRPSLEEMRRL